MKKQIFIICSALAIIPLLFCKCSDSDSQSGTGAIELSRVKNVTYTDAEYEMIIKGSGITSKGFCWGTSPNPTVSEAHSTATTELNGRWTGYMGGLEADTRYYARAFVTSGGNTQYGPQIEFRTFQTGAPIPAILKTSETAIQALVEANVMADGGKAVTARGVCYSTNHAPTVDDAKVQDGNGGVGHFSARLTGLTPETDYCLRPYAITDGVVTYGNEVEIKTTKDIPNVTTSTSVTYLGWGVNISGTLVNAGGMEEPGVISEMGICFSTLPDPTIDDEILTTVRKTPGNFTFQIRPEVPDVKYYVRTFATSQYGTAYGDQIEYTSRKVYGGVLLPGTAGQAAPKLNALNYTVASQTGPEARSAFQENILAKIGEAVNASSSARTITGIRFYFNTDEIGGTVAYFVINYSSGGTAYDARYWFKVTQNASGHLVFGTDYKVGNTNMTTLLTALAAKPMEKAKIQAVLDWIVSAPLVIDWISPESDTVYTVYHPATPDDYIRMLHLNVTGLAPVVPW